MHISSAFDSGNIAVTDAGRPDAVKLEIRKDNESDFYQWFHFRVTGARDAALTLSITNAAGAAYPKGWDGYRAVASYDRQDWFRVPTDYADGALTIRHTPERDSVWYAYFAPYSMERHADLVARIAGHAGVRLEVPGATLDGQDIDLVTIGEPGDGKRVCWLVARQHPGESMAEWWMEGLLDRLVDPADPVARELRRRAVFHVVPNMNPDGSRRGHLRTNAAGANLNREWAEPSLEKSPEVFHVRARMTETGCDFALDVHGDEALPYNFLAGMMGIPSLSERQTTLYENFSTALLRASPDFQTGKGYPAASPGKGNMTMCANWVAERFGCLAATLEMPFKDTVDTPDERHGWSPARCRRFGAAALDALHAVVGELR
jgi:murein tripeptide amidase MpaA